MGFINLWASQRRELKKETMQKKTQGRTELQSNSEEFNYGRCQTWGNRNTYWGPTKCQAFCTAVEETHLTFQSLLCLTLWNI